MRSMMIFMMYLLLIRHKTPIQRLKDKSSLNYFVVGQLEGIEQYFKHTYYIDPKVCNIIIYINYI
jgi:hypothetical protein